MKYITYKKFVYNIIVSSIFVGFALVSLYFLILNQKENIAYLKEDTNKKSQYIFESLYSTMRLGGNGENLRQTIERLSSVDKELTIHIHKSKKTSELFGKNELNNKFDSQNIIESIGINDLGQIEYVYPIHFEEACISCHTNSQTGDIAGAIEIDFPVGELKISVEAVAKLFMISAVATIFSLIVIMLLFIKRKLISPIENLNNQMEIILSHEDLNKMINLNTNMVELQQIEQNFNNLNQKLKKSYNKLKKFSITDNLTGSLNRNKYNEFISDEQQLASLKNPIVIVLFDLDKFKEINDTYGHEVGDEVLIHFSKIVHTIIDKRGNLFRIGGDEFVLILQNSTVEIAKSIIQTIDLELENNPIIFNTDQIKILYSVGIMEALNTKESIKEAIKTADHKMFEDKRNKNHRR